MVMEERGGGWTTNPALLGFVEEAGVVDVDAPRGHGDDEPVARAVHPEDLGEERGG